jgi:hypothetical protein
MLESTQAEKSLSTGTTLPYKRVYSRRAAYKPVDYVCRALEYHNMVSSTLRCELYASFFREMLAHRATFLPRLWSCTFRFCNRSVFPYLVPYKATVTVAVVHDMISKGSDCGGDPSSTTITSIAVVVDQLLFFKEFIVPCGSVVEPIVSQSDSVSLALSEDPVVAPAPFVVLTGAIPFNEERLCLDQPDDVSHYLELCVSVSSCSNETDDDDDDDDDEFRGRGSEFYNSICGFELDSCLNYSF